MSCSQTSCPSNPPLPHQKMPLCCLCSYTSPEAVGDSAASNQVTIAPWEHYGRDTGGTRNVVLLLREILFSLYLKSVRTNKQTQKSNKNYHLQIPYYKRESFFLPLHENRDGITTILESADSIYQLYHYNLPPMSIRHANSYVCSPIIMLGND